MYKLNVLCYILTLNQVNKQQLSCKKSDIFCRLALRKHINKTEIGFQVTLILSSSN